MSNPEKSVDSPVVKKRARYLSAIWIVSLIGAIFVVTTLSGLAINAWQGHQTRSLLVDCVRVGGKCFDANTERTADVVQTLIDANQLNEVATRRIVIISVTCQQLPSVDTLEDVQKCVDAQLALDKEKGTEGSAE